MVDAAGTCLVQSGTNRRFAAIAKASGPTAAVITLPEGRSSTCGKQGGMNTCGQQGGIITCDMQGSVAAVADGTPPEFQQLLEEFVDVLKPSKRLPATSHAL